MQVDFFFLSCFLIVSARCFFSNVDIRGALGIIAPFSKLLLARRCTHGVYQRSED